MINLALALVLGVPFGIGVFLVISALSRKLEFVNSKRIAPYLSDLSTDAHEVAVATGAAVPHRARYRAAFEKLSVALSQHRVAQESLDTVLFRAGRRETPPEWTSRRLLWTLAGAISGLCLGGAYAAGVSSATPVIGFLILGGLAGWWLPLWMLRQQFRARSRDLESEMMSGLELLGLCLAAGEDLVSALTRIARAGSGPFTQVIREALARIELGVSVSAALQARAALAGVPSLNRAIEHITATLERGTPLVDAVSAQVSDIREEAKQRLIESAGRNEVLMLIPLVFLILPVTIAFACYPGLLAIQTGL